MKARKYQDYKMEHIEEPGDDMCLCQHPLDFHRQYDLLRDDVRIGGCTWFNDTPPKNVGFCKCNMFKLDNFWYIANKVKPGEINAQNPS